MTRSLITVLVFAAIFAAPASAQRSHNDALARQALRNYAICAVERARSGVVERLLAMDPDDAEYHEALRRFARGYGRCLIPGHKLEFGGLPFAGGLAEALIASRYRGRSLADVAAAVPPTDATNIAQAIGRCVTREKPAAVTQLLATEPGTAEETTALQLTSETLPGCIPNGLTLTLNKPAVRAIYALGAYNLLIAKDAAASREDSE